MSRKKYPLMGKVYTTDRVYIRTESHDGVIEWKEHMLKAPRAGWVTRYSHLKDGLRKGGYGYDSCPYFEQTNSTPCIWITFWPTLNPCPVPIATITEGGDPHPPIQPPMTEQQKQMLRDDIKHQPRKNGRFTKL